VEENQNMSANASVAQTVREFYDGKGWKRGSDGRFADAAQFEDLRPVSAEYRSKCLLRVNRFLTKGGRFLLDVASGPVQFPEHVSYSAGYARRICADISFTALIEARKCLGDTCWCVQSDITNLPFRSESVDGVVSLHTMYHVEETMQVQAFAEIVRVLGKDCTAVVVYTWGNRSSLMAIALAPFLPLKIGKRILRLLARGPLGSALPATGEPQLYFHPLSRNYLMKHLGRETPFDTVVWRSLSVPFLKTYVHRWLFGKLLLRIVYKMEDLFPELLGSVGAYPLFVFRK
jgi:ubiquinone/menaquinone biosynthesis C-methylase UbiE